MDYSKIEQFTITRHLENICAQLKASQSRALVLTAETGAGKSTILPLAVMENFSGNVIMTEPRRLAVLGVANRIAALKDEECGQSVGYRIQLETKKSAKTRLEVVTEAILVRELQADQALEKYSLVILDEFHERSKNLDLALAFLKEAMQLRDDLYVIVMSATINASQIAAYFGNNTPVLEIEGKSFPVKIEYRPTTNVINAISYAMSYTQGNILVFLPGIYEIKKYENELNELFIKENISDFEICILHSSISLENQKKIILKDPANKGRKKVILSSAIAETSLTIPDVDVVIDSGLCRINRLNLNNGLESLSTERESEFSARQRCGRAGRERSGLCIRLWEEKNPLKKEIEAEILRTDLNNIVLECAERGAVKLNQIDFLTNPSEAQWNKAIMNLMELNCLDSNNHITQKGSEVLKFGINVNLAALALSPYERERKVRLILKYSSYARSEEYIQKKFICRLREEIEKSRTCREEGAASKGDAWTGTESFKHVSDGRICLEGFYDRLAKRIEVKASKTIFQFASGRKAFCENLINSQWIVAMEVNGGEVEGKIFEYENIGDDEAEAFIKDKIKCEDECYFEDGKIVKIRKEVYGKIILSQKRLTASEEDYQQAWIGQVKKEGLKCLPYGQKIEKFLSRVDFYYQQKGIEKPDLQEKAEEWLLPFIQGKDCKKLDEDTIYNALYWFLQGSEIDREVPPLLILANGVKAKVNYELQTLLGENKKVIRPVIEIIIQRLFECYESPKIMGMNVLFKMLSPAQRPLQITDNLESFWTGTWPEICKEMKARYPKHNWDYKSYK